MLYNNQKKKGGGISIILIFCKISYFVQLKLFMFNYFIGKYSCYFVEKKTTHTHLSKDFPEVGILTFWKLTGWNKLYILKP